MRNVSNLVKLNHEMEPWSNSEKYVLEAPFLFLAGSRFDIFAA